nr:uncharacterized protein LOC105871260 isoform X6 [Microcebus murinus]XP_012619968.1 uncharacterized protein LOC105871260 isoform X6 [Microcebus murinus]
METDTEHRKEESGKWFRRRKRSGQMPTTLERLGMEKRRMTRKTSVSHNSIVHTVLCDYVDVWEKQAVQRGTEDNESLLPCVFGDPSPIPVFLSQFPKDKTSNCCWSSSSSSASSSLFTSCLYTSSLSRSGSPRRQEPQGVE